MAVSTSLVSLQVPSDTQVSYGEGNKWSLSVDDMTPATVAYLLQNGFKQSMSDAAAFSKKDIEGLTDDEIAAKAEVKRQQRFDNIVAGSVGTRTGGARKKGLDKYINDIVVEELKAKSAQLGKPFPSGKGAAERINAMAEKWLANEARKARITEAARDRMEKAQAAIADLEDEDADIFADEGEEAA